MQQDVDNVSNDHSDIHMDVDVAAATQAAMDAAEELLDAMDDAFAEFDDEDFDLDVTREEYEAEEGEEIKNNHASAWNNMEDTHTATHNESEAAAAEVGTSSVGGASTSTNTSAGDFIVKEDASTSALSSAGDMDMDADTNKNVDSLRSPADVPKNIDADAMNHGIVSPLQMSHPHNDNINEHGNGYGNGIGNGNDDGSGSGSSKDLLVVIGANGKVHHVQKQIKCDVNHNNDRHEDEDENENDGEGGGDNSFEDYYNCVDIEIDDEFGEMSETLSIMDMSKPLEPINEEDGLMEDGGEDEDEGEDEDHEEHGVQEQHESDSGKSNPLKEDICDSSGGIKSDDNKIQTDRDHVDHIIDAEDVGADTNKNQDHREALTSKSQTTPRQALLDDQEEKKCEPSDYISTVSDDDPVDYDHTALTSDEQTKPVSDSVSESGSEHDDDPVEHIALTSDEKTKPVPASTSAPGSESPSASTSASELELDIAPLESNDLNQHILKMQQARSENLAQSNAEDVVNLSLEVQKLKEQLEQSNQRTALIQAELEAERTKTEELEHELQRQRKDFIDTKEKYCVDVQELMVECQQSKIRIQAAEEDAEQALELAKASDASRAEMEEYLQRSLDEIEQLRTSHAAQQQQQILPRISEDSISAENGNDCDGDVGDTQGGELVPYSSSNSSYASPTRRINRHKAVVSMGRNLLRQVMESDDGSVSVSTPDGSLGGSTTGSVYTSNSYYSTSSRRSVHNRHRIIERLNRSNDEFGPLRKDVVVFSPDSGGLDLSYTAALSSTMKNIGRIIRHSGKAMKLGGRWFSRRSNRTSRKGGDAPNQDELDMEAMTKSYCKTVESLVSKQKEEIKELKSFCEYLEEKVTETT